MSEPGKQEAIVTARDLTASVNKLIAEVARLNAYGRRNRHMIWITITGVAVDVAATVVAVVAISVAAHANTRADAASARAAANHAASVTSCRAGNVTRAGEVQLWQHVVAVAPPKTAKQRKVDAEFIAYVRHLFAPRDCARIYRTP